MIGRGRATIAGLMFVALAAGASVLVPGEAEASHKPLVYPMSGYITTSYHTYRESCGCYHDALDISDDGNWGDLIVAAYGGKVSLTCSGWCGGYGNYLVIDHGNGYQTLYAHLQSVAVSQGQVVSQGQLVGYEGSTGSSTGPHLHFEVRKGGVKQYIPGAKGSWVTRGSSIPYHYDLGADATDPETSVAFSGTSGANGWFRSTVTVKLSARDGGSGVAYTKYREDGDAWRTYSGPFTHGGEGGHKVAYYSVDNAGNTEPAETAWFKIDSRDPVTFLSLSGTSGNNGWHRGPVTVTLSPEDATSGVDRTHRRLDGGYWVAYSGPFTLAADGVRTLDRYSVDKAGNKESVRSNTIRIDGTPPVTSASLAGAIGSNGWYTGPVTVTLARSDATSGVAATYYRVGGGAWTAYGGPFAVSAQGATAVSYYSVDNAGNAESARAASFRIDSAPPVTSASTTGPLGGGGWFTGPATVTLAASDLPPAGSPAGAGTATSGVAATWYRVGSGAWTRYAGPVAVALEGVSTVSYRSDDAAGNAEAPRSLTVRVDATPPESTHALAGAAGRSGWWRSPVTVTVTASDATSGVAAVAAAVDDAAFAYAGPFAVAREGVTRVAHRAVDVAGNAEAWVGVGVAIDHTPPATTIVLEGPVHEAADGTTFVSEETRIVLSVADATSGGAESSRSWRGAAAPYAGPFTLDGPDGAGDVAAWSLDVAGNEEAPVARGLVLDATPPTLDLADPSNGSIAFSLGGVVVAPNVSDAGSGVARVEFWLDGELRNTTEAAPHEWTWRPGDERAGEHVLEVAAFDRLGHRTAIARNVTTVPTSAAGANATATFAVAVVPTPKEAARAADAAANQTLGAAPGVPPVGVVLEGDPAGGDGRAGVIVGDAFVGVDGEDASIPPLGLVAEGSPLVGGYRYGVLVDGRFLGLEG